MYDQELNILFGLVKDVCEDGLSINHGEQAGVQGGQGLKLELVI